jgi:hypothetical protein
MELATEWYRMPGGYTARYTPYGDEMYWHLFHRGTRVNGGLAADYEWAQICAVRYAWQHQLHGEDGSIVEVDGDLLIDMWRRGWDWRSLESHA